MTGPAFDRVVAALEAVGRRVTIEGTGRARSSCPAHDGDNRTALSIMDTEDRVNLHCFTRECDGADILAALGLTIRDRYHEPRGDALASYLYPGGFTVTRTMGTDGRGKDFRASKGWAGRPRPLYRGDRIPDAVTAGQPVYLVEGEEDVHAVEAAAPGVVAVSAPHGALNFAQCDPEPLRGAVVVAVVDADDAGARWAADVRATLAGVALAVRFTCAASGKDVADHLAAGRTLAELAPYAPQDAPEDAPDDDRPRYRFTPGGSFILDAADRPAAWWGDGDAILGAEGEALLIAGPQGTGKSTMGQQLALGRAGFPEYGDLLGLPITPAAARVLYLAMDRPRQIARSLRRMVGTAWRGELDARVSVWAGPPPFDLAKHPSVLRQMCEDAGASFVVVDSLKDAFLGLTDDEAAAAWNRARQTALAAGIDVCELHHTRKAGQGKGATDAPGVDSIYGSTWITSGCGSVVLLTGAPGDPIVGFHHVKQPMTPVGPFKLLHDQDEGRTSVWHAADLVGMARARGRLSALDAAGALFETDKPTPANKESARRRLEALTRAGRLVVLDEGNQAASRPRMWGAA